MTLTKIITHPGGAHKDDFLACSVLIAETGAPIERREPTAEDLADVDTAVVDVGHEWTPERSNFDHHQFPRDSEPQCALSLVLKHFGLYEDGLKFCEWLEPAEWFDTRGPIDTAAHLGVPREAISQLSSPIDITMLRRFAKCSALENGDVIYEVMRMVGKDLVGYLRSMRERLSFIAEHHEIWEFADGAAKAIYMPRTDPMPEEPSGGLGRFIEEQGLEEEVIAMVYPDRRSDGHGLSRYNDSARMEFTRIDGEDDVHFAHARGFVAKSSATDVSRLKELLEKAYCGG